MAFTRFNYDKCRTEKILEESTGPGRYMLNKPGWGNKPCFFDDPQIRMQGWGANLRKVPGGAPIDIDSDLIGITRPLSKFCSKDKYPNLGVVKSKRVKYPTCGNAITDQSRATHPAWMYKDLEQNHRYILFLDPQENTCIPFQNNLSTRILEKDYFVEKAPCIVKQRGQPIGVYEGNKYPPATLKR
jgi:hypothetical protein